MCACNKCHLKKRMRGMGATGTQTAISGSSAIGGTVLGAAIGGPIGAAVGAGISVVGGLISGLFTPDYNKINSSNYANEIASQMNANLLSWESLSADDKTAEVQNYYINNYNNLWNELVSYCSNPSLGTAGQNCISDREPTGKYPWSVYYLDPIQNYSNLAVGNAPVVVQNPTSGVDTTISGASSSTIFSTLESDTIAGIPIWLIAGGVLLALTL